MRCAVVAGVVLALALPVDVGLEAQRVGNEKAPRRPKLSADADTNSAAAYHFFGTSILEKDPAKAADAFYWASRLDPSWADPLYARRIALHMKDRRHLVRYVGGQRETVLDPETRRIDSLQYKALLRNPFLYTKLERVMVQRAVDEITYGPGATLTARTGNYPRAAWLAYSEGDFTRALEYYAKAIAQYPKAFGFHGARARVFYHLANYDSALVQQTLLLEGARKADADRLVYVYDSKAIFEYGLGKIHEAREDLAAAKEAYSRALVEDLSFYMAHAALAEVLLAQGDTAGAIGEYDLAVQLRGDDAWLRSTYGYVLARAGRGDEAIPHLRKAIELEPYFAPPYFVLGALLETKGSNEALDRYEQFVARARADDERVVVASKVLADFDRLPAKKPKSP